MDFKEQIRQWQNAAILGTMDDNNNPIFAFSMTNTDLLVRFIGGEIDARALMIYELSNRGMNTEGKFVGFNQEVEYERS